MLDAVDRAQDCTPHSSPELVLAGWGVSVPESLLDFLINLSRQFSLSMRRLFPLVQNDWMKHAILVISLIEKES